MVMHLRKPQSVLLLGALLVALMLAPVAVAQERERCDADLESCLNWMAKFYANRGWSGLELDDSTYVISGLFPGSPAASSGIQVGDQLVAVNGLDISDTNNIEQLMELQQQMTPGATRTYTLKRDGKRRNYDFKLVAMPFETVARMVGMHLLTDHTMLEEKIAD